VCRLKQIGTDEKELLPLQIINQYLQWLISSLTHYAPHQTNKKWFIAWPQCWPWRQMAAEEPKKWCCRLRAKKGVHMNTRARGKVGPVQMLNMFISDQLSCGVVGQSNGTVKNTVWVTEQKMVISCLVGHHWCSAAEMFRAVWGFIRLCKYIIRGSEICYWSVSLSIMYEKFSLFQFLIRTRTHERQINLQNWIWRVSVFLQETPSWWRRILLLLITTAGCLNR